MCHATMAIFEGNRCLGSEALGARRSHRGFCPHVAARRTEEPMRDSKTSTHVLAATGLVVAAVAGCTSSTTEDTTQAAARTTPGAPTAPSGPTTPSAPGTPTAPPPTPVDVAAVKSRFWNAFLDAKVD